MNYFIIENGLQVGPFSAEILVKNKNITAETLVWADGFADWTPAWQVEELRIMLQTNTQVQQTPPPVPPHLNNANNQETEPKEKKPIGKIVAIVAIAIIIILAIANPSKDSHKDAIKKELTEAMDKINERENGGDDLLSMGLHVITKMLSDDTVDSTLDDMLNYHNYIIYSISDVKFDGREHNVSYGFLGHVYTVNADDIVKCYESKMNSSSNEEISNDTDSKSDAVEDNSKDKKDKSDDALDKAADKIVDKVSKKVQDKVDEKLSEKLNEAADSTDGIIDKICKILGL